MCQIGDIILVQKYKDHGQDLSRHSFVVISDENGEIQGLTYDFIANVLSSFKSDTQRERKLKYPGNFPIDSSDTETNPHNNKSGYVKADQLYYFAKAYFPESKSKMKCQKLIIMNLFSKWKWNVFGSVTPMVVCLNSTN